MRMTPNAVTNLKKKYQLDPPEDVEALADYDDAEVVPKAFDDAGLLASCPDNKKRDVRPLTNIILSYRGDWNVRMVCGVFSVLELRRPCQHEYNLDLAMAISKRFGQLGFFDKYPKQCAAVKDLLDEALTIYITKLKTTDTSLPVIWAKVRPFAEGVLPLSLGDRVTAVEGSLGHHVRDCS